MYRNVKRFVPGTKIDGCKVFVSPCHHFHFAWENEFTFAQVVKVALCRQELPVNLKQAPHERAPALDSDSDPMSSAAASRLVLDKILVQLWSRGAAPPLPFPFSPKCFYWNFFEAPDKQTSTRHAALIVPTWSLSRLCSSSRKHMPKRHSVPCHYANGVGVEALLLLSDRLKADHIVTHHYSCKWCQELPNRGYPLRGLTH